MEMLTVPTGYGADGTKKSGTSICLDSGYWRTTLPKHEARNPLCMEEYGRVLLTLAVHYNVTVKKYLLF